jgi:hypothetical protein
MTARWQLLVYNDHDVLDLSTRAVRAVQTGPVDSVRIAMNLARAREHLAEFTVQSCNLVVLGSSTPEDATSPVNAPTREPTKNFIKWLKRMRPELQLIVLSAVPDEPLSEFLDAFDYTSLVRFDEKWRDVLSSEAEKVLAPQAVAGNTGSVSRGERAYLELDIELDDMKSARWSLERRGRDPFEDHGIIPLDANLFETIVGRSARIETQIKSNSWRDTMRDLSRELEQLLFMQSQGNQQFWKIFVREREQAGGLERTRIRFVVSKHTHGAFVEALKEANDTEHWMLNLPIFRKYPSAARRFPLFKDIASRDGLISCLVIEADREGGEFDFEGTTKCLPSLPAVAEEAAAVAGILKGAGTERGIGVVEHLRLGPAAQRNEELVPLVLNTLRKRHWNIIHFTGHAVQNGASGDAGLVLSGDKGSVLRVDGFSKLLLGTQFLFLSCCRSADSNLIMRTVEQYVPAVLGFRWSVDDAGAAHFARAFYRELFNRSNSRYKYLEYAFRDARKCLYDNDKNDPTWASPMLVLQLKQVETA